MRLVEELNTALGENGDYRVIDVGAGPGQDEIRVALIHRAGRVRAVGKPQTLTVGAFTGQNRAPLLQGFRSNDGGPVFAVAAVHLKSKGGCEGADDANRERDDGQSCWNALRVEAAGQLSAWALEDPAGIGSKKVVIIGDLNSYAQEDPIRLLRAEGWRDTVVGSVLGASPAHGFVWLGRAGRLDHVLVSPELAPFLSGIVIWNSNSDESEAFDYQRHGRRPEWYQADPYRASDHDPLIVGLDFSRSTPP